MGFRQGMFKMIRELKDNSPTILAFIAAGGVIATAVMAVKATPKAKQRIGIAEMNKGEPLNRAELAIAAAPAFVPAALVGVGTILCIFGADHINREQKASLMSAYLMTDGYLKNYQQTLIERHGEEIDKDVRREMARKSCDYHCIDLDVPDNKVIFYDELSKRTFRRYERDVIDAEYHFNRNFVKRGYANLNEFYEFLGIEKTDYGEVVGWSAYDGYCWVDFYHEKVVLDDGGPEIYMIGMVFAPDEDYLREWQ